MCNEEMAQISTCLKEIDALGKEIEQLSRESSIAQQKIQDGVKKIFLKEIEKNYKDKKMEVFCDECGSYQDDPEKCLSPSKKRPTYLSRTGEAGKPSDINDENNCESFSPKK